MRSRILFLLLGFLLLTSGLAGPASAELIIDTGPGAGAPFTLSTYNGGLAVGENSAVAGRIDLTQAVTITSIKGWMGTYALSNASGDVSIVLYENSASFLTPGTEVAVLGTIHLDANTYYDWYGLSDLSLSLAAGSYWIAFEGGANSSILLPSWPLLGSVGPYPTNPLPAYAYSNFGDWTPLMAASSYHAFGLQVEGTYDVSTAAPEPSTLALAALGLGGVFFLRRRMSR